jgi:hypothetical protein
MNEMRPSLHKMRPPMASDEAKALVAARSRVIPLTGYARRAMFLLATILYENASK